MTQTASPTASSALTAVEPFLRWAGGKRWLVPHLRGVVPSDRTYVEPFLGGGSIFFGVTPPQSSLADSNERLIETYRAVRSDPGGVIDRLIAWPNNKDHYYTIRDSSFPHPVDRAAQFIFLNKTCWNGLYRVNRQGRFNVPYGGRPNRPVVNPDSLRAAARALQNAALTSGDYSLQLSGTDDRHFVYLDPPYATRADKGFLRYNPRVFSWVDQQRLADDARAAARRGSTVVVSNANCPEIVELYGEFRTISIPRNQTLAANSHHRTSTVEILLVSSQNVADLLVESGISG